jgi:hypothetical protein
MSALTDRRDANLASNSHHLEIIADVLRQSQKCLNRKNDGDRCHQVAISRTRLAIDTSRELLARSRLPG